MNIPDGFTEAEVLEKLEHSVKLLSKQFVFGYYDIEDIRQEARQEGIKKLPKYDSGGFDDAGQPKKKLENFFYSIIKNHLHNLIRNKCHRSDPPCKMCHEGRQNEHPDGQVCEKFRAWKMRNRTKANLVKPSSIDNISQEFEFDVKSYPAADALAEIGEATAMIDEKLPIELRSDYLRMRSGESLPKARRNKVEEAVKEILEGFYDD